MADDDGATPRRRSGRPPRVDLDRIAQAAAEIGFADVTMKNVAESVGMSVPGLYYYVRGRDDLLRLAAAYRAARRPLPVDTGQGWAEWLHEWARYMRGAMAERELLDHYISGEVDDRRMIDVIGSALDLLCREGFTPEQAQEAWETVSAVALGAAVNLLRRQESIAAGRPMAAQLHAELARSQADEHPALRALVDRDERDPDEAFEAMVDAVLVGLAARFDRPAASVVPAPPTSRAR